MPLSTSPSRLFRLPRTVWALGFVSLFMDASSEAIHSVLPLYVVGSLHITVASFALMEGVAEAIAAFTKLASGYVSDATGHRKRLAVLGYGLSACTKPLFPLASGFLPIALARSLDRIGKGIRGAPRDALVAATCTVEDRGIAFGLRQALDSVGAFIGPAAALLLLWGAAFSLNSILWLAVIPAALCVFTLLLGVEEAEERTAPAKSKVRLKVSDLLKFPREFVSLLMIVALLTLARPTEAFLILKGGEITPERWIGPAVLIVMNIVYAAGSVPAGAYSDREGRFSMLLISAATLAVAAVILSLSHTPLTFWCGIVIWGFHLALSQGVVAAAVADFAPPELRASAFGLMYLVQGICVLLSHIIPGLLWDRFGAGVAFMFWAVAAIAAATLILFEGRQNPKVPA